MGWQVDQPVERLDKGVKFAWNREGEGGGIQPYSKAGTRSEIKRAVCMGKLVGEWVLLLVFLPGCKSRSQPVQRVAVPSKCTQVSHSPG